MDVTSIVGESAHIQHPELPTTHTIMNKTRECLLAYFYYIIVPPAEELTTLKVAAAVLLGINGPG